MDMKDYLSQSWGIHATETTKVYDSLNRASEFIKTNEDIAGLARLITHICGDHLGQWQDGMTRLAGLKNNSFFAAETETDFALKRSIAVLKLCADETAEPNTFSNSEQIRIYAMAAGMLFERAESDRAKVYFAKALYLTGDRLEKADPACRALAIAGNNLACSLEEKKERSESEIQLMILAAQTARKYWELAGGQAEVSSAEYRLSQSYLQANQAAKSYEHAQKCIKAAEENKLSAVDFFYGYEALALAEKAMKNKNAFEFSVDKMKTYFNKMEEKDKSYCQKTLNKMIY